MEKFIIRGNHSLRGEIEVRGAKNAATPILAACLLSDDICLIENLPLIEDVFRMIELLKSLGAEVTWVSQRALKIRAKEIEPAYLNQSLVCQMRSSILLMGALIARFKKIKIASPGGCLIGQRSLSAHLKVFQDFGIKVTQKGGFYFLERKKLQPGEIIMNEISVTGTENALLVAALTPGRTIIKCAAAEPYIQDLGMFLKKMGIQITGLGTHTLVVNGTKKLKGAKHFLIYDPIEMTTFLALGASVKNSHLIIKNTIPEFILSELVKFKEAGLNFKIKKLKRISWGYQIGEIEVSPSRLKAIDKVHNLPYPGFAPDSLPPFAVMLTQAKGVSLIHDWMFEGRQKYIEELKKMGAQAIICDPHRVLITGPTQLYGTEIKSYDLRAGASLIIAALTASGQSKINNVYQVDRGYEKLEKRLQKLGARIERTSS